MSSTTRHRAYAWEDQAPTVSAGGTHDGLAILQAIGREELPLPPALRTLDITPMEAEPGRVSFTLAPSEFHLNPFGLVPGGVLAALIDTAMGCAVHSLLPVGAGYVTSELNVRFLRSTGVGTGALVCTGEVLKPGRRSMVVQARVTNDSGRDVAIGGCTCLVIAP
ncbi:MAG TPA: PaaI family thioesterase [Nocardioides sp.]|nr:PaaI family thioesterase [Nocardioides sp.]